MAFTLKSYFTDKDFYESQFEHVSAETVELAVGSDAAAAMYVGTLIASATVSSAFLFNDIIAAIYQDDDAHDTCTLVACLNPLHPGPCKGWKGNLFKVAPNAFHALEAARVEKANHARLKKIQALKDAGKPIPKKLLTPIVAKPHPHAGKTANVATGEAHAAGQAISHANGVHVNEPGKVTLGQAIKATDATAEKGKLGKKPTVASKGIAHVIAQEKVTPQYKLDKAAGITPEQWSALSHDEQALIRGELAKIQKDGFGPQQAKATALLDKFKAEAAKPEPSKPKLGGLTPGADTITTPSGKTYQKVTLKDEAHTPSAPAETKPEAPTAPAVPAATKKEKHVYTVVHNGTTTTRTSTADYTHASLVQKGHDGPVVVWGFHKSEANALSTPLTSMQKKNGFKVVGALPVTKEPKTEKVAATHIKPGDKVTVQGKTFTVEKNLYEAQYTKPGAKKMTNMVGLKPVGEGDTVWVAAHVKVDKHAAGEASKPKLGGLTPGADTITTPSGKTYQKVELKPSAEGAPSTAQANAMLTIGNAISPQKGSAETLAAGIDKMKEQAAAKGIPMEEHHAFKAVVTKLANSFQKQAYEDKMPGVKGIDVYHKQIAEHIKEGKPGLPPAVQEVVDHHAKVKAGDVEAQSKIDALIKAHEATTPEIKTASEPGITHMTPTNLAKQIQKHGSAKVTIAGITHKVGFENAPDDHAKLIQVTGLGGGTGHYVINGPNGEKIHLGKGEQVAVHNPEPTKPSDISLPEPATATILPKSSELHAKVPEAKVAAPLPEHVQHAIAMAKGHAPGASWSKNHLAAYLPLKADEFHALDPEVQAKIKMELNKAQAKLLDPKKKAAVAELLERFKDKPGKIENVDFKTHLNDHSVTTAQAKQAVAQVDMSMHAALAAKLAGVTLDEDPDSVSLKTVAKDTASYLLGQKTGLYSDAVIGDPNVQQAIKEFKTAQENLAYAQSVAKAKKDAYSKVTKRLLATSGDKLSPIEKQSLQLYQQYLLFHPVKTDAATLVKQADAADYASQRLIDALQKADLGHKPSNPSVLTPAMIEDQTVKLLGGEAAHPKVNLSMAELKAANQAGMLHAAEEAQAYPPDVVMSPGPAAKYAALSQHAGQLAATELNQKKLDTHLKGYHQDALITGKDIQGNPLSAEDKAVIATHADMLKQAHSYLDAAHASQTQKLAEAKAAFHVAAKQAQEQQGPKPFTVLTDADKTNIQEAYRKAWNDAASKVVLYGVKGWTQKSEMKSHPEYVPLTQDLGELRALSGKLALAHAEAHTAELNVPVDPDTGTKLDGPEKKAWLQAVSHVSTVESQAAALHKTAQMRIDKIRTDVGLKKRALPKLDNAAVKTKAAESGYYKTGGYGGINYGKQAKAKNYMLAKVGPKHAVVHVSAADKKFEKQQAENEKIKLAAEAAKAVAAKIQGTTAVPAPKLKSAMPSAAEAGTKPNAEAAAKYGFTMVKAPTAPLGDWESYSSGPAYVASEEALADLNSHLTKDTMKHGLAAQKEFKWSINNMQAKGATTSQRNALYSYTGSGYTDVNNKLNGLPPGMAKTGSTTITNIDNAMAASPPMDGDVVLYRGFKSPHTVFSSGKWNDVNVAGMEWSQRSYSSTSGSLSTAQGFAGHGGVVMRIVIPKEMQVHGINAKGGQHGGENEIILQRGLRYRVVADYGRQNNMRYIDVMVVPNPYDKAK